MPFSPFAPPTRSFFRTILRIPTATTIPAPRHTTGRRPGITIDPRPISTPFSSLPQSTMAAPTAAAGLQKAPYIPQDVHETATLLKALEAGAKAGPKAAPGSGKRSFKVRKSTFAVKNSRDGLTVDSWKFSDWDYKRRDLPTYARGLFTTRSKRTNEPEIAVRGYDKFFNVGEVNETEWKNIFTRTQGPYELTLKENGCIIFVSGMEDDTLIVCSKHSTGDREDATQSHASVGEMHIERQLAAIGKTKADLARELRARNVTAVAELCDDSFEEHILAYGADMAGLYLHGMNLNLPEFATYPSPLVQSFAEQWGFRKTGLILMDDPEQVRTFLDEVAETGAHDGRDVEGFVVRCRMSHNPDSVPYRDWFFKYKFEEPYLMYRQWRECTKALISGKTPKYKKHRKITEEYLLYARKRLQAEPWLGKLYVQNHGIIKLRNDFLEFKHINGTDAANMENEGGATGDVATEVDRDVVLVPIATIGCGKTTVAQALSHLFGWGHVQNDNLTGKAKKPPRFTNAVLEQLETHPAVVADRNNAGRHERRQIITDLKVAHSTARLVALYFAHDAAKLDTIRQITQARVLDRGDNHQTIHAATDEAKFIRVMEGFIDRFEPCNVFSPPDDGFDSVIELDPTVGSRENLETVVRELHRIYPNLIKEMPTAQRMDEAIAVALRYEPTIKHTIPSRGGRNKETSAPGQKEKKKPLEYMAVHVPAAQVNALLDKAFAGRSAEEQRFYKSLKQTRRVQNKFHVTLMHRASGKEFPDLWERYVGLHEEAEASGVPEAKVGECEVMLERVVYDDRIMAIVARLLDEQDQWRCVNKVAHVTVGTRDATVKPKESNELLEKWLDGEFEGSDKMHDVVLEGKPVVKGVVRGVANFHE